MLLHFALVESSRCSSRATPFSVYYISLIRRWLRHEWLSKTPRTRNGCKWHTTQSYSKALNRSCKSRAPQTSHQDSITLTSTKDGIVIELAGPKLQSQKILSGLTWNLFIPIQILTAIGARIQCSQVCLICKINWVSLVYWWYFTPWCWISSPSSFI